MTKKCAVCDKNILEKSGKLQGTMVKVKEGNKNHLIHVCSECEKQGDWLERAVIKSA